MKTIAITGATGYIGRKLVAELIRLGERRIRVLSRSSQKDLNVFKHASDVEIVEGDLCEPESLKDFLEPGCIVINLLYLWGAGEKENIAATKNLLNECISADIGRLIHCSTAAVAGRVPNNLVTESTQCRPVIEYGITKLKIEKTILKEASCFDIAILRPTSVFGPEGDPLKKLAKDLTTGSRFKNYLKSCLFGCRRMNLVHIDNVLASIHFLVYYTESIRGEIYIISDDDSPSNNFTYIERFFMQEFNIPAYRFPRLRIPLNLLGLLLRCLGRNNVNPRCDYSSSKLVSLGLKRPLNFETGLDEYSTWYSSSYLERKGAS